VREDDEPWDKSRPGTTPRRRWREGPRKEPPVGEGSRTERLKRDEGRRTIGGKGHPRLPNRRGGLRRRRSNANRVGPAHRSESV